MSKILVIGDLILDTYMISKIERICPEAPVPIANVIKIEKVLGGSGNVIKNLISLGAEVGIIGRVGRDDAGTEIIKLIQDFHDMGKIFFTNIPSYSSLTYTTPNKIRITSGDRNQLLLRVDIEKDHIIKDFFSDDKNEINYKYPSVSDFDLIIISDYGKGAINKKVMDDISNFEVPIIVDPKPCNAELYGYVDFITPNEKEFKEMGSHIQAKNILITKGSKGMELVNENGTTKIDSKPIDVFDVQGAGDTVVAALAIALCEGENSLNSSRIANECARDIVTRFGTSTVARETYLEIKKYIQ